MGTGWTQDTWRLDFSLSIGWLVGPFFNLSCPLVCQRKNSHVVWPDMTRCNVRGSSFIQWNILPATVSHSALIGWILTRIQVQYKYILGQPRCTREGLGKGWTSCISHQKTKVYERNGIFWWISFKQPTVIDIVLLLCKIWMLLLGVWREWFHV